MQLTRLQMNAVADLLKIKSWDAVSTDIREKAIAKCQEMLPNIYQITEIEGVKNLAGAQAVLERACLSTLNALGAKPSDATLDQLILDRCLSTELTAATPKVTAGTTKDGDLDF